jgi:hypothetical protein
MGWPAIPNPPAAALSGGNVSTIGAIGGLKPGMPKLLVKVCPVGLLMIVGGPAMWLCRPLL